MIHEASILTRDGLQRCRRCGYVLSDYRNVAWLEDDPAPAGWAPGAAVEVLEGNPRYAGTTVNAPNCKASRWKRFGAALAELAGNLLYQGPR